MNEPTSEIEELRSKNKIRSMKSGKEEDPVNICMY